MFPSGRYASSWNAFLYCVVVAAAVVAVAVSVVVVVRTTMVI